MSDYVPIEIMKRHPVKSLLRFRCVSKQWKSLIDSSEFMAAYNVRQIHDEPQRLLVRYNDPVTREQNFVLFVDDDQTFPRQEFNSTVPVLPTQLYYSPSVVCSSHGLLCLFGYSRYSCHSPYNTKLISGSMVVLWNPSIRKLVYIAMNGEKIWGLFENTVVGFGVCPTTNDPTIVKFTHAAGWGTAACPSVLWVVEVFSLSSGTWRNIPSTNLPSGNITIIWDQVVIDKFIYWHSFEEISAAGEILEKNQIMSYDMTTEEIGLIQLPGSLAH